MELQAVTVFFVSWLSLFAGLLIFRWPERLPRLILGRWEHFLPFHTGYRRHKWLTRPYRTAHFWDYQRITLFHYFAAFLYTSGNALFFLQAESLKEVQRRAAVAAVLNLAPVILGGRTRLLADVFNLSLQQYYIVHRCLAWTAIADGAVHAGIVIHGGMPKTGQAACGLLAIIALLFISIATIVSIRYFHAALSAGVHVVLACSAVLALLFHLWLIRPLTSALLSKLALSVVTLLFVLGYAHKYLRAQRLRANIQPICNELFGLRGGQLPYTGASFVTVQLPREVLIHPGAYFYLHFERTGIKRFRGEPMMAYGWKAAESAVGWNRDCQRVKELTFLIEHKPHLSSVLSGSDARVTLEGPYGRELSLHTFTTVMLVSEGSGVAGIVPLATALAQRRNFDREAREKKKKETKEFQEMANSMPHTHRDKTARLNVVLVLKRASELNWVTAALQEWSRMDPRQTLFHVWIYLPTKHISEQAKSSIPQGFERHWNIWPVGSRLKTTLQEHIETSLEISPGDCAVAVEIRHAVSDAVLRHSRQASFFELEHQPRNFDDSAVHHQATGDYEMAMPMRPREHTVPALPGQSDMRTHRHRINVIHVEQRQRSLTANMGAI